MTQQIFKMQQQMFVGSGCTLLNALPSNWRSISTGLHTQFKWLLNRNRYKLPQTIPETVRRFDDPLYVFNTLPAETVDADVYRHMISLPDLQNNHDYFEVDFLNENETSMPNPRSFLNTTFFEKMCNARESQNNSRDPENIALYGFRFYKLWNQLRAEYNYVQLEEPQANGQVKVLAQDPERIECVWLQRIMKLVEEVIRPDASVNY
jgi:hypothetical protein